MRVRCVRRCLLLLVLTLLAEKGRVLAAEPRDEASVVVNWNKVLRVSKTEATLQVVVMPPLRRGSLIHDRIFGALHDLQADDVRFATWFPYPKLAVAELEPPRDGKTFWDFTLIEPIVVDFFQATAGHPAIVNFSTIPQWMFKTQRPVAYPSDPDQVTWTYEQGTELRDPSMKELGDYYARVVSWLVNGGFEDEYGKWHASNHHFKAGYWEVLNEIELEHRMTPETYTHVYDSIVEAIRREVPGMKFVGLALAGTSPNGSFLRKDPRYFEYFLDRRNHKPGVPIDMISYHCYTLTSPDQDPELQQYSVFDQAEAFLSLVRYIDSIRERLSPDTRTTIDEIGTALPDDFFQSRPDYVFKPIPDSYWNLSAAVFAYLYVGLARLGIDMAGESQLVGYPTQFPCVTMLDWSTGRPNARYWVLKLLRDNFGPGDRIVDTDVEMPSIPPGLRTHIVGQGFMTRDNKRKILLINKRNRSFKVSLPEVRGSRVDYVDVSTGFNPIASVRAAGKSLSLRGWEVAVVTLP